MSSNAGDHVVFLDTTVVLDCQKSGERKDEVSKQLASAFTFVTSMTVLEFKATLIQECVTIHNHLRKLKRFTVARDRLVESNHRQSRLRANIFNNLLSAFNGNSSFDIPEELDLKLAEKARLHLQNVIPRLYAWVREKAADQLISPPIECTRATEPPSPEGRSMSANMPICKKGKNKKCNVESHIRSAAPGFLARIDKLNADELPDQVTSACDLFREVMADARADLSHSDCRRGGDCLLAIDAVENATHVASTNMREWRVICSVLPLKLIEITYPRTS